VESSEINIPVLLIAGEKEASIGAEHAFFCAILFSKQDLFTKTGSGQP
jgi:hypothetical protein